MRSFRLALVFLLVACGVARGADTMELLHVGGGTTGISCGSYVGPGDLVSGAKVWWGLRAYTNAYAQALGVLATIVRQSDNTSLAIHSNCSGNFDTAAAGTFCAATNCRVCSLADQTGGGYAVGAGTCTSYTLNADLIFNCLNTNLPCIAGNGGNSYVGGNFLSTVAQPITVSAVAERTGAFTTQQTIVSQQDNFFNPNGISLDFWTSANTGRWYAGTTQTSPVGDSAWHALQAVFNGASSVMNVDGTDSAALDVGTGGLVNNTALGVMGRANPANYTAARWVETGLWSVGFSGPQRANMCNNQRLYWGTSGTC